MTLGNSPILGKLLIPSLVLTSYTPILLVPVICVNPPLNHAFCVSNVGGRGWCFQNWLLGCSLMTPPSCYNICFLLVKSLSCVVSPPQIDSTHNCLFIVPNLWLILWYPAHIFVGAGEYLSHLYPFTAKELLVQDDTPPSSHFIIPTNYNLHEGPSFLKSQT